jgi:hypothetical protein
VGPFVTNTRSGVARCCYNDTLYVNTAGFTGAPGQRLRRDAAGVWTGALAAILQEMSQHTGMALRFVVAADCVNPLNERRRRHGDRRATYCLLRSSNETVPLAYFTSLWVPPQRPNKRLYPPVLTQRPPSASSLLPQNGFQSGVDPVHRHMYGTTSFMESDSAALLAVKRKDQFGIWQLLAPFETSLWLALFAACLGVSLLMPSVLRDQTTGQSLGGGGVTGLRTRPSLRLTMFYHAASMMFGSDDLEWTSNTSSRTLHLSCAALTAQTLYTASRAH